MEAQMVNVHDQRKEPRVRVRTRRGRDVTAHLPRLASSLTKYGEGTVSRQMSEIVARKRPDTPTSTHVGRQSMMAPRRRVPLCFVASSLAIWRAESKTAHFFPIRERANGCSSPRVPRPGRGDTSRQSTQRPKRCRLILDEARSPSRGSRRPKRLDSRVREPGKEVSALAKVKCTDIA